MIITYLRSSSDSCWDWCPHKYFMEYVLGMKRPANKKADIGTTCHKALELLALRKLAEQENLPTVSDEALMDGEVATDTITPASALDHAFAFYSNLFSHHTWTSDDKEDCWKKLNKIISWRNGMYNPLNLNVVYSERRFDMPIPHDWAKYTYRLDDGTEFSGQLSIKGTIDLVVRTDDGQLEAVDWKTGRKYDWNKEKDKTDSSLQTDNQLNLYYYAMKNMWPDENPLYTIFYVNDGPTTLSFGDETIERMERHLKKRFNEIRLSAKPERKITWKCNKMCGFSDGDVRSDESTCTKIYNEIQQIGLQKVIAKRGKSGAYNEYGSGGGKQV